MKKFLSILTLLLAVCSGAWADYYPNTSYYNLATDTKSGITITKSSTWNTQSISSTKFANQSYSKGLKMESATTITFSTTGTKILVIAQGISTNSTATFKLDGTELNSSNSTIMEVGSSAFTNSQNVRWFTTTIEAGSHTITKGDSQAYLIYLGMEDASSYPDENFITLNYSPIVVGNVAFSVNTSKYNFGNAACTFMGHSYANSLKQESATYTQFTTTRNATLTVVQNLGTNQGYVAIQGEENFTTAAELTSDNSEITTYTTEATVDGKTYKNVKIYKIQNLPADTYQIKKTGDVQSYIAYIGITYVTGPYITTQPASANYVTGATIAALSVEATASAGDLAYQWYSCDDAAKTNAVEISEATNASYAPTTAGFYYVTVTDDNGSVESDVAEISISDAAVPTISIESTATEVVKNTPVTITATMTGTPEPTIQWYSNTSASNNGGTAIEGATSETYSPSTTTPGVYYFYAVASNSQGNTSSDAITITVNASNQCLLYQVVYSNSFDAFIMAPSGAHGTCKAYYMEGTEAPTITSVKVSDDATYSVEGNEVTVTAEDGVTTAVYDITLEAVTPYAGVGELTFDGTETWVKTGNAFSTDSKKLGWVFSKNDSDWSRETPGKNRVYFFFAPNTKVSFENGGTARNIKVYKNGTLLSTPTSTSSCEIAGDTDAAYMIAIVSNQTSGDGALKSITIEKNVPVTVASTGFSTYVNADYALNFEGTGITPYVIKANDAESVTLEAKTSVAAGEPVLLYAENGTTKDVPAIASAEAASGNLLVAGDGSSVTYSETNHYYVLATVDNVTGFYRANNNPVPVGKAYLNAGTAGARFFALDLNGETTDIGAALMNSERVNNEVYNLNGQRVMNPAKGLYIVNGRKVVIK